VFARLLKADPGASKWSDHGSSHPNSARPPNPDQDRRGAWRAKRNSVPRVRMGSITQIAMTASIVHQFIGSRAQKGSMGLGQHNAISPIADGPISRSEPSARRAGVPSFGADRYGRCHASVTS
jgi:hypothetical protein